MTNKQLKKVFDRYNANHKKRYSNMEFAPIPDVFNYLSGVPYWIATTERKEPVVCNCCGMIKYHTMQPVIKQYYIVREKWNGVYLMQRGHHQILKKLESIHTNKKDATKEAKQMTMDSQKSNIESYESEKKRNLKHEN